MILTLNKTELTAARLSVNAVVKAGLTKETEMKSNSIEYKVLQVNKEILEKINYASDLHAKMESLGKENGTAELEFNRQQVKVLVASMLHTAAVQAKMLEEYDKRPPEHPSFGLEEGRRKADYVDRLKARMGEVNQFLFKLREAL